MNKFETPIQFETRKFGCGAEIEYSDLMEIVQGGPEVGTLSINGEMIMGRYGGPLICNDEYLFVPALVKKFLGVGFKLSRINVLTLEVKYLTETEDLILLDRIEDNRICFFRDLGKTLRECIEF